jgi:hypothetical protein
MRYGRVVIKLSGGALPGPEPMVWILALDGMVSFREPRRLSTASSDPRRSGENALWHAPEERRDAIRAAGVRFSERQHHQMREAHAAGRLIGELNAAMERKAAATRVDPDDMRAMARAIKAGLAPWEEVLIRRGEPWIPYFTARARQGPGRAIKDAEAYVPFL